MYLISSTDGGKAFGPAKKLKTGTGEINGCPMDGGSLAVGRDGRLVIVWRRQKEIFLTPVGGNEELLGTGKNPVVARANKGPYSAWIDSAGVRLLRPDQKEPIVLDPDGRYIQLLALPEGTILAVWESNGSVRAERLP